jgi:GH43 family beta-xylosidase
MEDGRAFGILYSEDLVNWQEVGSAMDLLPGDHTCYWAPEVVYDNGSFYLYYSVGSETNMEIRVALGKSPSGPFTDSGHRLTHEQFAIDAHVFVDEDGQRYLFYATDFLEHTHIGTGTVVDRMVSPYQLAGHPQPVSRARFDWQVYDPQRKEKGGVRWHTVEGPFVLKHQGRYFQMFSGGNWQNLSYGVSYATSSELPAQEEWEQHCDGEQVLPILRTLPDLGIIGPGHNSVVRGPDNIQQFCVYHRWVESRAGALNRILAVDRLEWIGDRLDVIGPSSGPQPAPARPFASESLGLVRVQTKDGRRADSAIPLTGGSFVFQATLQAGSVEIGEPASYGFALHSAERKLLDAAIFPAEGYLQLITANCTERLPLPGGYSPQADHLLDLRVNHRWLSLSLDYGQPHWEGKIEGAPQRLTLFGERLDASFSALELISGWQDEFLHPEHDPEWYGWKTDQAEGNWQVQDGALRHVSSTAEESRITRPAPRADYELTVTLRLIDFSNGQGTAGVFPALDSRGRGPLFFLVQGEGGTALQMSGASQGGKLFPLPKGFDPFTDQQFRFIKEGEKVSVWWRNDTLGEAPVPAGPCQVGLYAHRAAAAFDQVRAVGIIIDQAEK